MTKLPQKQEPELEPDAWARFERAVDVVAKSPPQHRVKVEKDSARETGSPKAKAKRSFVKVIIPPERGRVGVGVR
jgi:hypothetical protein